MNFGARWANQIGKYILYSQLRQIKQLSPDVTPLGQGTFVGEETSQGPVGPRKSFLNRKRQERAAIREGLAEWQANPYFCSGRVTVPALADTFACQSFFNR